MMRRSKREYSPSAIELAGQRAWNEAWGYHRDQARRWFIFGSLGLVVGGIGAGAACWLGAQAKVVPYVVNSNGPTVQIAQLMARMPDTARISGHLTTWVEGMRTVSVDAAHQKRMIDQTYDWTEKASVAIDQLNTWYIAHNPNSRATVQTIDVDVQSVIPQGGNVWQTDWKETAWSRAPGHVPVVTYWRMIVTVQVRIPETDAEIRVNWDGVWTQDFHVQQVGGPNAA